MADRMNIKFTIQAVDRFSRTMNSLERKLDSVQRKADSLDLNRHVDIDVDTAGATAQLEALRTQMDSLGNGDVEIDVDANTSGAIARLRAVAASAENMEATIRVNVASALASAQLARLQAQRNSLERRPTIISVLLGGYMQFRRNMDRIATTGRNVGEIIGNTFMGLATTFSTVLIPMIASTAGAIGSLGVMVGTTAGATLGLLSSFVGAGFAAGGFAAVAIPSLVKLHETVEDIGSLEDRIEMAKFHGNAKAAAKAQAELNKMLSEMSPAQREAAEALKGFKSQFEDLRQAMEPGVLTAYAGGLTGVSAILTNVRPMIEQTVGVVNELMDAMNANIESSDMQAFFGYLNAQGAQSLGTMSKALGNFLQGFLNMMVAFGPLAVEMENGFLSMSEGFREWTAGLGDNAKFQAFVDYVRTNWPAVRRIIGSAIAAIIETFAGFSGYAVDWMSTTQALIDRWRDFAQGMGENAKFQAFVDYIRTNGPKVTSLIGSMVGFLVALGVALAPVGAIMVEVATAIFDWMTNMLQANPVIGEMLGWVIAIIGGFFTLLPIGVAIVSFFSTFVKVIGMVAGPIGKLLSFVKQMFSGFQEFRIGLHLARTALTGLLGPVGIVIGVLMGIGAVFVYLWKTSETFRDTMTRAFTAVKDKVSEAIDGVVGFIKSTWGGLTEWWTQNGEMIKQAASNVWDGISKAITTAMDVIMAVIKFVWPVVEFLIVSVWNNIKGVISGALDFITGLVTAFAGLFTGNWSAMWEGIKQMFGGAVEFLWNAVQLLLWGKLLKGLLGFASMFGTGVMTLWTTIKTLFMRGVTSVRTTFANGWNAIVNYIQVVWARMGQFVDDGLSAVSTRISAGLTKVKNFFVNAWTNIYVTVGDFFIRIRTAVSSGMNTVKTFFSDAWTWIYVKVSDIIIKVRTVISDTLTSVINFVSTFVSKVITFFVNGFNRVLAFIRMVFDDIAYVINIVSTGIRGTIDDFVAAVVMRVRVGFTMMKDRAIAIWNMLKERAISIFNTIRDRVVSAVNTLKDKALAAWNTLKDRAISAFNTLKDRVITSANNVKDRVVSAWNTLKDKVVSTVTNIVNTVKTKFEDIRRSVATKMTLVRAKVREIWNSVMDFFKGINLYDIGTQIIQGLINGIKGMAGKLISSAKGVVEGAIEGAKNLLGIKSPSRVFMRIGEYTMMGMQGGIESEATRTIRSVTRVADAMTKAFAPELEAVMSVTGGYGSNNGYATASHSYAQTRAAQAKAKAKQSEIVVPVHLNGREIARATSGDITDIQRMENDLRELYSGGV